ncbi:MAG: hypothetical protein A3F18_08610 [Legionellales bacterium RIFCSPHIGHO2_12_FULL_37_14]|nr:MAG: hypothetical protein A3F18_08610 [Legionellales bacterium RIFCSPHIGHO2_12_FULL_37_14]
MFKNAKLLRLNKARFARPKNRNRDKFLTVGENLHALITFGTRQFIVFLLAPAIVTASLLSQETFLIIAGVALAFGYLASFFHRLYKGQMSLVEFTISVLALAAFISLAVYFLLPLFTAASTFLSVVTCIGIVAFAINSFFLLKSVIVPLTVRITEKLISLFYQKVLHKKYLPSALFSIEPLNANNKTNDIFIIQDILQQEQAGDDKTLAVHNAQELNSKIKPYNQMLAILVQYVNKYHKRFLGSVRFEKSINTLIKAIKELTEEANPKEARDFMLLKLRYKVVKINLLREARHLLITSFTHKDFSTYNKLLIKYFNGPKFISNKNVSLELQNLHAKYISLLDEEIKRQITKAEKFTAILDEATKDKDKKPINSLTEPKDDEKDLNLSYLFKHSVFKPASPPLQEEAHEPLMSSYSYSS